MKGNTPIRVCKGEASANAPTSAFSSLKSKECQTLSWKTTHKYNCQRRDALHDDKDTHSAREEKNLTSWLNAWTVSLCSTAIAALDLANHESDYLLNHWYVPPFSPGPQIKVLISTFVNKPPHRVEENWTEDRRAKIYGSWLVSSVHLLWR